MTTNQLLNALISKSQSFAINQKGQSTTYRSEGELENALEELGFSANIIRDSLTGNFYHNGAYYFFDEKEQNGLYLFVNGNEWFGTKLTNGIYSAI